MISKKGANKERTTKLFYSEKDMATGATKLVECESHKEMDATALKEGETRMTRCLQSPFTQPPLDADFGDLADSPAADAVLNGTYTPPQGIDKYTKMLIEALRRPATVSELTQKEMEWTPSLLMEAWKKQRITTFIRLGFYGDEEGYRRE